MSEHTKGIVYQNVDICELDRKGNYYCKHIQAMTDEDLRSKSDIAGQLGIRDYTIDQLKSRNAALEQQLAASEQQRGELVEDLTEILGCFTAAEIEGFHGKLFDMPYEDGNLHGIITRRIIPAWQKAENALAKSQGVQS